MRYSQDVSDIPKRGNISVRPIEEIDIPTTPLGEWEYLSISARDNPKPEIIPERAEQIAKKHGEPAFDADRFTVLPIDGQALRELAPLLRRARNESRCILGNVLTDERGTHLVLGSVSRKCWLKVCKLIEADAEQPKGDA